MVILKLSKSALCCFPLWQSSPLRQSPPACITVHSAAPLPSAGVCQMSPDVRNSIDLSDVPFTSNKLRQRVALSCRTVLFPLIVLTTHKHTPLSRVSCISMLWTWSPRVIILDPNLILQHAYEWASGTGRCIGPNKQHRGVACVAVLNLRCQVQLRHGRMLAHILTEMHTHAHICSNEGRLLQ